MSERVRLRQFSALYMRVGAHDPFLRARRKCDVHRILDTLIDYLISNAIRFAAWSACQTHTIGNIYFLSHKYVQSAVFIFISIRPCNQCAQTRSSRSCLVNFLFVLSCLHLHECYFHPRGDSSRDQNVNVFLSYKSVRLFSTFSFTLKKENAICNRASAHFDNQCEQFQQANL
jgi:hypothetical protein